MQDNLVIVESPAKAKTIEKFLGSDYKVMSSYGHIRDLKKKELSVNEDSFEADYEIPEEKRKLVSELKAKAKAAKKIWLASDEDREGEAISWHLCEVLGLDKQRTNRIVFHEITPEAILEAIKNPRHIDMNLVNAQQARRVLDRIVGFRLSPVLWRKVKPALSAGRVQSVAVRLVVEREREVTSFKSEPYYRITAVFETLQDGKPQEIRTELDRRFSSHDEALAFLDKCRNAEFRVKNITKKPLKRSPQPPFTTSTLQQEAARRLGFTVSQTMMMAQRLYESGNITYMRTDSVNLSSLCINASKKEIIDTYGKEYSKSRKYHTSSKGAQEAHEAIRPTYMSSQQIDGNAQERRLYELIWKRTIASQMADALIEKTTIEVSVGDTDATFIANGEVVNFPGFLQVYGVNVSDDDNDTDNEEENTTILPSVSVGDILNNKEVVSSERYSLGPVRYTEGSLVKKMEELGIGRPSTYAPTVSTIQQREYVVKGDKKGEEHKFVVDTLKSGKVSTSHHKEVIGGEKGKLMPTDIGTIVNDFLMDNFPSIMDYNFTANIEEDFDHIAEGKEEWTKMMKQFDKAFHPVVDKVMNSRNEHKAGERELGIDPASKKPVYVKIGRFGPIVQIGSADDQEKPRFAQLPKDISMDKLTLQEALELFRLPRELGKFEGHTVTIGTGRYGAYILCNGKYTTLPHDEDPLAISLDTVTKILEEKVSEEKQRHLKQFEENEDMEILNGRYGPYICYEGKNYRLPRNLHQKISELTYEQCKQIVNAAKQK